MNSPLILTVACIAVIKIEIKQKNVSFCARKKHHAADLPTGEEAGVTPVTVNTLAPEAGRDWS